MYYYISNQSNLYTIKRLKYFKKLLISKKELTGRSNLGRIILVGRGGSKYKRFYRLIDFKRILINVPGLILHFEYDLNRNCYIMLVIYKNGLLTYNLGINLLRSRMIILNLDCVGYPYLGYNLQILNCIIGSFVNSLSYNNVYVARIARSAGTYIQLVRKFGNFCLLRLPSKEERFFFNNSKVIVGRVASEAHKLLKYNKAGILRRYGIRPKVRGTAKNPIDHPHGGAGRTATGMPSVSPWGVYTKGVRTSTRFRRLNLIKFSFFRKRTKEIF